VNAATNHRPDTVLVVGATGRTGRHVVSGLLATGVGVRALVRHPLTADLPEEVVVVAGSLQDVDAVQQAARGAQAAFLLWMGDDADEVEPVIAALTEHVGHIVYLSAADLHGDDGVMTGIYAAVEAAIEGSGATWTFVRGGGFAANTLEWAEQIRAGDVVRAPFPEAGRSLVDERDLAEVAVRALIDPAHAGRAFALTGPETLTQREQVATIGAVLGRELTLEDRDPEEVRQEYAELSPAFADQAVAYWASLVEHPEPVADGVREVLGRPPRRFEEWVRLHVPDFERLTTAEVAQRYAEGFRTGQVAQAIRMLSPRVVRVAPLEDGGEERDVRGLPAIAENAERQTEEVTLDAVEVAEPLVGEERFAIRFVFDETVRATGKPRRTIKLSLCTVAASRIVREEVFYHLGGPTG
jgi:uncharacterized protein YbjT (DUF2867 family)